MSHEYINDRSEVMELLQRVTRQRYYQCLLETNAQDTQSGVGQYFTPRPLIQAIVDVIAPQPKETVCDPACGTGGFFLTAHDYLVKHNPNLTKLQKTQLKEESFKGWELVQATARLCAMNMLLHGISDVEASGGFESGGTPLLLRCEVIRRACLD